MKDCLQFIQDCLAPHPQELRERLMRAAVQLIMSDKPRTWEICKDRMAEIEDAAVTDIVFEIQGKCVKYNPMKNTFTEIGELYCDEEENPLEGILVCRKIGCDVSDSISKMLEDYSVSEKNQILSICCAFSLGECTEEQKNNPCRDNCREVK